MKGESDADYVSLAGIVKANQQRLVVSDQKKGGRRYSPATSPGFFTVLV